MAFENFRPKPKQETTPIVTENTAENRESIENQIEQETVKLDTNLESLKAEIDGMGGIEGVNKKIEFYKDSVGFLGEGVLGAIDGFTLAPKAIIEHPVEVVTAAVIAGGGTLTASMLLEVIINLAVGNQVTDLGGTEILLRGMPIVAAFGAGVGLGGGMLLGSTAALIDKSKKWWENRKLKSLKKKAEVAGIA